MRSPATAPDGDRPAEWPAIPFDEWRETCAALHLWTQVLGKYRLAHTPWVNHSWHATLYVVSQGLTTGPVPDPGGTVTIDLDLREHRLVVHAEDGRSDGFPLEAMSVAAFHGKAQTAIAAVGGNPGFHSRPNEIPGALPFAEDLASRPYDADAVRRFHAALLRVERVFAAFRTAWLGKASPVHLFWGALDLAVTRFSGRRAPLHPGGIPSLPDAVTREAYSHEVSSAGFWPGGNGAEEAMFYSYAYPEPAGFRDQRVAPVEARYDDNLREFLLPYDAVRRAADPEQHLLEFLQSAYRAAAELGGWDRDELECEPGTPGVPRRVE